MMKKFSKVLVVVLSNPMDAKLYVSADEDVIKELEDVKDNELEEKWILLQRVIEDLRLALPITNLVDYLVYYTSMLEDENLKSKILQTVEKIVKGEDISDDELTLLVDTFYRSYILDHLIINLNSGEEKVKTQLVNLYKEIINYKDVIKLDLAERLSWYLYVFKVKKSVPFEEYLTYLTKNVDKYIVVDNFIDTVKKHLGEKDIPYIQLNYNLFLAISKSIEDFLIEKKLVSKEKIEKWKNERLKDIKK
jgi:hypothetical protein